ncbi:hypothetical protein PoB_006552500 [Plakobranchus ocellatus]|uniref:Uncharacterized protein n=1 Tax=Plakobranchus ocellatus TaxID=259542 RepID=A0AAV4D4K1_9GAST|nr:hypothetical protein PoB_006552500 [Plakobranchus ocellatus]
MNTQFNSSQDIACDRLYICTRYVSGVELEERAKAPRPGFLYRASPQQGDLRLSGPPSGQGAGGGSRTRDRGVPADLRADSLATVPPTPRTTPEIN